MLIASSSSVISFPRASEPIEPDAAVRSLILGPSVAVERQAAGPHFAAAETAAAAAEKDGME